MKTDLSNDLLAEGERERYRLIDMSRIRKQLKTKFRLIDMSRIRKRKKARTPKLNRTASIYKNNRAVSDEPIPKGVWVVPAGQFFFYGVTSMLLPLLFKHLQEEGWAQAPTVFANALTAAAITTFVVSNIAGIFADHFGEKMAYQVAIIIAICSAFMVTRTDQPFGFILSWSLLKSFSEGLRGPKNAYMGKHAAHQFNFVSNVALNSGMVGGILGAALGASVISSFGLQQGFQMLGIIAACSHTLLLLVVSFLMEGSKGFVSAKDDASPKEIWRCAKTGKELTEEEALVSHNLCAEYMANFEDGVSFTTFRNKVVAQLCITSTCLQFAINVTAVALFQPLLIDLYAVDVRTLSLLQSAMSIFGLVVALGFTTLASKQMITAQQQALVGALFILIGVAFFVIPPFSKYRIIASFTCGLLGQIVYSGPLHVLLGQTMSKDFLTSTQLSILGSATALGQAGGCAVAPHVLQFARTGNFLPFSIAVIAGIIGTVSLQSFIWKYNPHARAQEASWRKKTRNSTMSTVSSTASA